MKFLLVFDPFIYLMILFYFFLKNDLFYLWLCWDFIVAQIFLQLQRAGLTVWVQCSGFSLQWLLLLWSAGSRACGLSRCCSRALEHAGSVVAALGLQSMQAQSFRLSGSRACGLGIEALGLQSMRARRCGSRALEHAGSVVSALGLQSMRARR